MGLINSLPAPSNHTGWPWTEETDPSVYAVRTGWPKISIVIPSYQQGAFIEETIRSILLQNYPNLELIIIDGGSTDTTFDVIKKYDKWIGFWVSEKDNGIYHALNNGLDKSSGEYIYIIGIKDLLAPNSLFYAINESHKVKPDVIFGNSKLYRKGKLVGIATPPQKVSLNFFLETNINHQAMLMRREVLISLGGFDESFTLVSDWIVNILAFIRGYRFQKVNETICHYDLEGLSSNLKKASEERKLALNTCLSFLQEDYLVYKELQRYKLSRPHQLLEFLLDHSVRKLKK